MPLQEIVHVLRCCEPVTARRSVAHPDRPASESSTGSVSPSRTRRMKAARVSRGNRGFSVQTLSPIVGVSSRWAAISGGGHLEPGGTARFPATNGSGDPGLGEPAGASAVLGGRPEFRDRDLVLRRTVALMTLEAVAWVALAQASHEAIASHLGHDRGGRNGRAGRVSVDDQLVYGRSSAEREAAVHETKLRPLPEGAERPLEASNVGGIDPDPVDLARGDGDERNRLRVAEDGLGETLALGTPKALRVVHFLEEISARAGVEPLEVEENAGGHDRAGQAGAPHLVDARDQADATSTVVGNEGRVAH